MDEGPPVPTTVLRPPGPDDEAQATQGQAELAADNFEFVFRQPGEPWSSFVARVRRERLGVDVAPDRVPSTFLFAEVNGTVVGRVSIRHELSQYLASVGGHIGYAVRPAFRRRGYAFKILQQSLDIAASLGLSRVLITCDDDNLASIKLIESCGGVHEGVITPDAATPKRRYWIAIGPTAVTDREAERVAHPRR